MKYFLLFSMLFFIATHNFLIAMEQKINNHIQEGFNSEISDTENIKENINKKIVHCVHNLLHIKTDISDEEPNHKGSMERALEHLKIKHPKKYEKITKKYSENSTTLKSKNKNKKALSSRDMKIIQLCLSMMEDQNDEDQKNYHQEQRKKWLSFGWGVITTAATITVSLYAVLNPVVTVVCNGTVS